MRRRCRPTGTGLSYLTWILLWIAGAAIAVLSLPVEALAAGWQGATHAGFAEAQDLSRVEARGPIRDRVLETPVARSSQSPPTRVEEYKDEHGHTIRLGTSIAGLNLSPYAEVLAGTIHTDELSELRTLIVNPVDVAQECGASPQAGVVACYAATNPEKSFAGEMVIPSSHSDLLHAMIHEYGHHMDNARVNLGHVSSCDFASDGSRRWFFARDADDDLFSKSGCDEQTSYERQLAELFAEDFVALHGVDEWFTSDFPPPTRRMLDALGVDIQRPFVPTRKRYRGKVSQRRNLRLHRFTVTVPTFFSAALIGPRTRRTDLDLFLWRSNGRRALEKSRRRRSRERVERILPPGSYDLGVSAYKGRGRYRLVMDRD